MNKLIKTIAAALAAAAIPGIAAAQELSPDEQRWVSTINIFHAEAAAAGMRLQIGRVVDAPSGSSPVAAKFADGVCTVILAVRGNPASAVVQGHLPGAYGAAVARAAAVAHEYGHCVHMAAIANGMALPPALSPTGEAMADVFALAWFARRSPDDYPHAVRFFKSLRGGVLSVNYADNLRAVEAVRKADAERAESPLVYAVAVTKE